MVEISENLIYRIGCDESNHGRFPEIFVAVSSIHPDDVLYHAEEISKKRFQIRNDEQAEKKIKEVLECRQYRFLTLYEYHQEALGPNSPKAPAFGHIIASLEHREPTKVFIDGHGNLGNKRDIEYIISGRTGAKHTIRFVPHGDQHFPLLNIADAVASILFKTYQDIGEDEEGPFDEFKVNFEIEKKSTQGPKPRYSRQSHRSPPHK